MNSWLAALIWFVCVQVLGFYAWPMTFAFFRRLPDRGYAFSKILGLLIGGFLFWAGWAYGLLPNTFAGAWLAALLLALTAAGLSAHAGNDNTAAALGWLRAQRGLVLATEALFLIVFLGWLLVRMRAPSVCHTEQPMDLMLLNSLCTSRDFPPHDAWLSGYGLGYYYFGPWLMCFLGRLANQPPELAYNLGQSTWLALLTLGTFGLGRNLLALAFPLRRQLALAGGCASALVVGFTSNLRGLQDALASTASSWWWQASRALSDSAPDGKVIPLITEFPFFSYLLGDNHAHVLAMPFLLLALATALNLRLGGGDAASHGPILRRMLARLPLGGADLLLCAVVGGALLPLNTWDFPAGWLLLVAAYPAAWDRHGLGERLAFATALTLAAALLFLPYLLTTSSQFAGFVPNRIWRTPWRDGFMVFGGFLPGLLLLLWLPPAARTQPVGVFVRGVAVLGLLLALTPEVVIVRDSFANRMNTVFKFYYQAWLLLGLAATWAAGAALTRPRTAWAGALALLAALLGLVYPLRTLQEHFSAPRAGPLTLSVSAALRSSCPDEYRALQWLQKNTPLNAVLAEAPGLSYRPETCRLSTFSGRPTLLGWEGHERQWRGASYESMAGGRSAALRALYTTGSTAEVVRLLAAWNVDYVVVGPEEHTRYGITAQRAEGLRQVLQPVYTRGAVSIYQRKDR
ncbi:MAG: DUF2298 domain-containing protein [Kiritimatiellaeota bacterium]|nr:DUF2298 domain-containing protein [Kiritimatiellota bacterium]